MSAPWDARIANDATMVNHCLALGGVIIKPKPVATGFGTPKKP